MGSTLGMNFVVYMELFYPGPPEMQDDAYKGL